MKLVTYRKTKTSKARLGVINDGQVTDVQKLGLLSGSQLPDTMLRLIDLGPDATFALSNLLNKKRNNASSRNFCPNRKCYATGTHPNATKEHFWNWIKLC